MRVLVRVLQNGCDGFWPPRVSKRIRPVDIISRASAQATPTEPAPTQQQLAPPPTATNTPPPNGVSLNCDGTFQRVRIIDQGASGKTISVDDWDGANWVNAWSVSSGDPMLKQLTDDAGRYQFGDCEVLVVVPFQHSNPQLWFELGIYAWNGAAFTQTGSLIQPVANCSPIPTATP